MVAKARSDWGQLPLGIRLALFATAVLVAGYGLVAVRSEPLAAGPDGAFLPAPGQAAVTDPAVVQQLSFGESTPRGIYTPMIGASAVLVQSLTNDGQVPLTVTGIEPSDLLGSLLQVKDPRVAVMSAPEKCCDLNSQATWSASGFRPVTVAPGATTYVAVHVLMTNCQLNRGSERIESIKALTVDYSVPLGIGADEWLTVAARRHDDRPLLAPADSDARTLIIRIHGGDLAAFQARQISRDDALKRMEVRVF